MTLKTRSLLRRPSALWRAWPWLGVLLLAACSALPERPVRAVQYDFGPGPVQSAAQPAHDRPVLALSDLESGGVLEGSNAVLYRLGYADSQELRPYAQARWSLPPAQLVRQRLRDRLGRQRTVLSAADSVALVRSMDRPLPVLRVELEEFSQLFDSPGQSLGLVRLRATLVNTTPAGDVLLGQTVLIARSPAPTPDASGGVQALTQATDQLAGELDAWLDQTLHP
ncbi:MAG: membrane integrity-associated transporter subunit PqiC [Curvibacter sp.]|nr:membrane integrity-associated transporter subunit PqiC [Curvibacter sp.]